MGIDSDNSDGRSDHHYSDTVDPGQKAFRGTIRGQIYHSPYATFDRIAITSYHLVSLLDRLGGSH